MGVCCGDTEVPFLLVFDCISYGVHEINAMDGMRLQTVIEELCRRIRVPLSKISQVLYNYEILDWNAKIRHLGVPNGGVLLVKFADIN